MNFRKWLLTVVLIIANILLVTLLYLELFPSDSQSSTGEPKAENNKMLDSQEVKELNIDKTLQPTGAIMLSVQIPDSVVVDSSSFEIKMIVDGVSEIAFTRSADFPIPIKDTSIKNTLDVIYSGAKDLYLNSTGILELGEITSKEEIQLDKIRLVGTPKIFINKTQYLINE